MITNAIKDYSRASARRAALCIGLGILGLVSALSLRSRLAFPGDRGNSGANSSFPISQPAESSLGPEERDFSGHTEAARSNARSEEGSQTPFPLSSGKRPSTETMMCEPEVGLAEFLEILRANPDAFLEALRPLKQIDPDQLSKDFDRRLRVIEAALRQDDKYSGFLRWCLLKPDSPDWLFELAGRSIGVTPDEPLAESLALTLSSTDSLARASVCSSVLSKLGTVSERDVPLLVSAAKRWSETPLSADVIQLIVARRSDARRAALEELRSSGVQSLSTEASRWISGLEFKGKGLLVYSTSPMPGGWEELQLGDIIVRADSADVVDEVALRKTVVGRPGGRLTLLVWRLGDWKTISILPAGDQIPMCLQRR